MADDKSKAGPEDAARVNVNQDHELRYWCEKFACTEEDLRAAVDEVGPMAEDVAAYLEH